MPALDSFAVKLVVGALILLGAAAAAYFWRRWRDAAQANRARAELRAARRQIDEQREAAARLASRVIATSSTSEIRGFAITRQIEAVFADGYKTPGAAVQAAKAEAAKRGGNALINLVSERLPSSLCSARGDAVIVKPVESE